MALFGNNYSTPGRGVLKTPHEKRGFFKFWEIVGGHLWKLVQLNFIYFLFCLPIIALVMSVLGMFGGFRRVYLVLAIPSVIVGPATAAMMKIARNFSQERPCFVVHHFNETMKKNFKQGMIMGIVDVIFVLSFLVGLPFYSKWAENNTMMYIPLGLCLMCMIMFFMMHFYIYLLICSTNLNMRQIIKNSFYLVSLGLKQSLWTLLACVLLILLVYLFMPISLFVLPIFPMAFIGLIQSFNCFPVIRKYVIQPYYDKLGEKNPEFKYKEIEEGDMVFKDNVEHERTQPIRSQGGEPKSKNRSGGNRKGKTIS